MSLSLAGQPLRRLTRHILPLALGFPLLWFAVASAQEADQKPGEAAERPVESQVDEVDEEYYELLRLFVDTLDHVDRNYVKDVTRRELMEAAIEGMLSKLDQYSNYIPASELDDFKRGVESEFGGIGIHVALDEEDGRLTIISPLVGSPAYRAGLAAGDKILEIEGQSTEGMTVADAVELMKGRVGTEVRLKILHAGNGNAETVNVPREIVRIETVMGYRRQEDDTWSYLLDEEKGIGYLRLTAFSRRTAEELKRALEKLQEQGMRALVLDLRFNPGGLLSSAIEVSDLFVSEGRIVSTEGRNYPQQVWNAHAEGTYEGFPIAILVNRFSASASEIVAACLKDHDRAVIVGERTWGKGSVQNIIQLEGGRSALKLTTAGYLRPNGQNIHRFEGASPSDDWGVKADDDLEVKLSMAETRELHSYLRDIDLFGRPQEEESAKYTDKQLEKAVESLEQQLAESEDSSSADSQSQDEAAPAEPEEDQSAEAAAPGP